MLLAPQWYCFWRPGRAPERAVGGADVALLLPHPDAGLPAAGLGLLGGRGRGDRAGGRVGHQGQHPVAGDHVAARADRPVAAQRVDLELVLPRLGTPAEDLRRVGRVDVHRRGRVAVVGLRRRRSGGSAGGGRSRESGHAQQAEHEQRRGRATVALPVRGGHAIDGRYADRISDEFPQRPDRRSVRVVQCRPAGQQGSLYSLFFIRGALIDLALGRARS